MSESNTSHNRVLNLSNQQREFLGWDPVSVEKEPTELDLRLSGVIDMASEPCSLLAEHISAEVGDRMKYACLHARIRNMPYLMGLTSSPMGVSRNVVIYGPEDQPVATDQYFVRLTDTVAGDPRIDSLDLVADYRLVTRSYKRGVFSRRKEETHYEACDAPETFVNCVNPKTGHADHNSEDHRIPPSRVYVVAKTRRNIAIPLFSVSTDRTRPDCSFISVINDRQENIPELLVTKEDVELAPTREQSLIELRRILEDDREIQIKKLIDKAPEFDCVSRIPKCVADLGKLAVLDRINQVIGPINIEEETIVDYVIKLPKNTIEALKGREIKVGSNSYDAAVSIGISKEGVAKYKICTNVNLPGAPNFEEQQVFPTLWVYAASDKPVRFEGIEVNSPIHRKLVSEFNQLISI